MKRHNRDERTVHRAHADEREPQDPLAGAPTSVAEALPTDSVPVRHLAHRMLEAIS
jgi:hypothetical protein